jgi:hypothetical protein
MGFFTSWAIAAAISDIAFFSLSISYLHKKYYKTNNVWSSCQYSKSRFSQPANIAILV